MPKLISRFIKENKTLLATLAVVAVVAVGVVIYNGMNKSSESVQEKPNFVQNDFNVPAVQDINQKDSPLLYDMKSGTLGLNEDYVKMIGSKTFVFATKKGSSKIYVSWKQGNEGNELSINLYLPRFSTEPLQYYFKSEEEMNKFISGVDSDKNIDKITEGEYTFYVASSDKVNLEDMSSDFYGLSLNFFINNSNPGDLQKAVDNGKGIPTSILRAKCDLDSIKKVSGIDFNDPFWDNVNYNASYKSFNGDKYVIISPVLQEVVAGTGHIYSFSINDNVYPMDREDLDALLKKNGFEDTETAVNNHVFANKGDMANASKLN